MTFLIFGAQKFTAVEASGIQPVLSNSPITSWLNMFGALAASRVVGSFELTFCLLLAFGFWRPASRIALLGAIGACLTFLTTLSFLLTTPGVFAPDAAPILSADGLFLLKDIVLLAASIVLLADGLALLAAGRHGFHAQR